ncbi:hypothetical protein MTR_1g011740 [Medicago truncatula]|uniref:Uncharacterized protein n=1 Tax=Medicago truncatula TaxID=3880 RepID=G7I6D4_MEDTR|nr:hypothetical protein MTR_1g011740 [Medicago truncatula]
MALPDMVISTRNTSLEISGLYFVKLCWEVWKEKVELELNQTCANRKEFDIGSDDPKNPKWYVVCANDINTQKLPVARPAANSAEKPSTMLPAEMRPVVEVVAKRERILEKPKEKTLKLIVFGGDYWANKQFTITLGSEISLEK